MEVGLSKNIFISYNLFVSLLSELDLSVPVHYENTLMPRYFAVQFSLSQYFALFSVRPINFYIAYIFAISRHSAALFMSLNLTCHNKIAVYTDSAN